MAAVMAGLPRCALDEAKQSWLAATSGAAPQACGSSPERLLEKEESNMCRLATWSSEASTAAEDTKSDMSVSPRSTSPMAGRVRSLCHTAEGSRRVQDALDKAASDGERELLASELHGHAIAATRCQHANHVLQKCISVMPAASLQFMIDELLEQQGLVKKVATHRFGSCIVEQLLRKCAASQVGGLVEAVLQDAVELSCHTFGHFVVKQVLESGTADQKYSLVRILEQNMESIGWTTAGGGVIAAAMSHAEADDKVWIARAVVQDLRLLLHLAQGRLSFAAVSPVLAALSDPERARAHQGLIEGMAELKASKYGKKVAASLALLGR